MTELTAPKADYNLTTKVNSYSLTAHKQDYQLTTMFNSKATANAGAQIVQPEQSGFLLRAEQDSLVYSYPSSYQDETVLLDSLASVKYAHSFMAKAGNLLYVDFYLKKYGSPTGNATAVLYSHTGTFGGVSSPVTALATSSNYDVSGLTTSFAVTRLTFPEGQNYPLENGAYYFISLEYSGGNATNYLIAGVDYTAPVAPGIPKYAWYSTPTVWTGFSSDLIYYIYASGTRSNFVLTSGGDKIILSATR